MPVLSTSHPSTALGTFNMGRFVHSRVFLLQCVSGTLFRTIVIVLWPWIVGEISSCTGISTLLWSWPSFHSCPINMIELDMQSSSAIDDGVYCVPALLPGRYLSRGNCLLWKYWPITTLIPDRKFLWKKSFNVLPGGTNTSKFKNDWTQICRQLLWLTIHLPFSNLRCLIAKDWFGF